MAGSEAVATVAKVVKSLRDPRAQVIGYLAEKHPRPVFRREIFENIDGDKKQHRTIEDQLRSLVESHVIGKLQVSREVVYYLNF